jgi:dCMP deaminase
MNEEKRDRRPSWDEYFMNISDQVATRSTCLRRQVGAVIVKEKRILATGYNGAPSGLEHCLTKGCLREQLGIPSGENQELCRGLHAEQNAIIQAALHGVRLNDAIIYSTHKPCVLCSKMIINAGLKEIRYVEGYPDKLADELLNEARINVSCQGR